MQDTHVAPRPFHLSFFKSLIELIEAIVLRKNQSSLTVAIMKLFELIYRLFIYIISVAVIGIVVVWVVILFVILIWFHTAFDFGLNV